MTGTDKARRKGLRRALLILLPLLLLGIAGLFLQRQATAEETSPVMIPFFLSRSILCSLSLSHPSVKASR